MLKTDLLDHGFVRLVDSMGSDVSVVRAARVSYDAAWRAGDDEKSDAKLIRYLMRNRHTTPFESVTMTFEIQAPIFVFRQWHRHRTQSYNELSARYRELPNVFYIPDPDKIGTQSESSKQARVVGEGDDLTMRARLAQVERLRLHCKHSYFLYQDLLAGGWPRELARAALPVNIYSHMFTTLNLHNFFHFAGLRDHPHAQDEIRVYAQAAIEMVRTFAPVCVAAWEESR
jgi:thymidylate synthase (FAD)